MISLLIWDKKMEHKETKVTVEAFNRYLKPGIDNAWREDNAYRQANKSWLKKSAQIALKINRALRDKKMTQKDLADKLNVSAQQINKILKGRENLTLETISRLESALDLELISILRTDDVIIKKSHFKSQIVHKTAEMEFQRREVTKSRQTYHLFQYFKSHYKELGAIGPSVITTKLKSKTLESHTALSA